MREPLSLTSLSYEYPAELVATEPRRPSRVMWVEKDVPQEYPWQKFLAQFTEKDCLVLNDTRVLKRRVFAERGEILFLDSNFERTEWEVLFPSRDMKIGESLALPGGVQAELIAKGRPQKLRTSRPLSEDYFTQNAELPLPPYIQKARDLRHNQEQDEHWYQTVWAQKPGSLAAPTASLHFSEDDLEQLEKAGVKIKKITLHVGLGTFLPLTNEAILAKTLHQEEVEISFEVWKDLQDFRKSGGRVWALGTTVTRSLESCARGILPKGEDSFRGKTDLFLQPGDEFKAIDGLLTNFHQPESSLLALVYAFSGARTVQLCYQWAIKNKFRLFSYGDLSAWIK